MKKPEPFFCKTVRRVRPIARYDGNELRLGCKNCSSLTSQRPCFDRARKCPGLGHVTFCPSPGHVTFRPGHAAFCLGSGHIAF
jgi:hypothetical protein